MFIDFIDYFKTRMKDITSIEFTFSAERQLNSSSFENEIVIRQLSGTPYNDSGNIPYQLDIITSNPELIMDIFTGFSLKYTNQEFKQIIVNLDNEHELYSVTPYFQTPVVISSDERFGSNVYSRVVLFFNAFYVKGVNDIKNLKIDGEEIRTLNSTISYVIEPNSLKISGQELNKIKKKNSTTAIAFKIVSKNNIFCNKLFKIAFGKLSGNTPFNLIVETNNGMIFEPTMIISSCIFNNAENQIPSIDVNLSLYDERD